MAETPEDLWERTHRVLRMPRVGDWNTFPFAGEMRPRELRPPVDAEAPRAGVGGQGCRACQAPDEDYLWTAARWRVKDLGEPTGLPVIVVLEPRAHLAEPGDLDDAAAAELGVLLARVERAVRNVPGVGRVHVCRWGDGSEHLHWWFMARPARIPQLVGSFAAIWDDVLPPMPPAVWRDNLEAVAAALDSAR